jgi:hypothetical protein
VSAGKESATVPPHSVAKPAEKFPRSAASDLWRQTLSQIPSQFGRLVYLAGLRDPNSGQYLHHGLSVVFGEEAANDALKSSHEDGFARWLDSGLEQQREDLDLYFSSLESPRSRVLETWLRLKPYQSIPPDSARTVERSLFLSDLEILLTLMRHEHGVSSPDPDE